ncbi:unnamed protein product [Wickerhamomyces anomalus]
MAQTIPRQEEKPIRGGEATSTTGSTGSSTPLKKSSPIENLLQVASYPRTAWFVGNVVVVFNTILYLLSYKSGGWLNLTWYKFVFIGALDTFGIVLYENLSKYKTTTGSLSYGLLLQDDNVHYLYDGLIWLILPRRTLATAPFLFFSIFHVLSFSATEILPALNVSSALNAKVSNFAKIHHERSRRLAANFELLLLIQLIFRALFWRKGSWISLILYSLFIKIKTERSVFTRSTLKNWEVRIDGLVSAQNVPPVVKAQWGSFKRGLKSIGSFSLVREAEEKTK